MQEDEISYLFYCIKRQIDGELFEFYEYIENIWIKDDILWCPDVWCVLMQHIRTNNDVEGWHYRISNGQGSGVNMLKLVLILYEEANLIPLQAKLLSQGHVLRAQSKVAKSIQAKLNVYWDEYNSFKITARRLFSKCHSLYLKKKHGSFSK